MGRITSSTNSGLHSSITCRYLPDNQLSGTLPYWSGLTLGGSTLGGSVIAGASLGGSNRLCGNLPDPRQSSGPLDLSNQVFNCSILPDGYQYSYATCNTTTGFCTTPTSTPTTTSTPSISSSPSCTASVTHSGVRQRPALFLSVKVPLLQERPLQVDRTLSLPVRVPLAQKRPL